VHQGQTTAIALIGTESCRLSHPLRRSRRARPTDILPNVFLCDRGSPVALSRATPGRNLMSFKLLQWPDPLSRHCAALLAMAGVAASGLSRPVVRAVAPSFQRADSFKISSWVAGAANPSGPATAGRRTKPPGPQPCARYERSCPVPHARATAPLLGSRSAASELAAQ